MQTKVYIFNFPFFADDDKDCSKRNFIDLNDGEPHFDAVHPKRR